MNTESNDPAFPDGSSPGLTKREYFAAQALQGLLSDSAEVELEDEESEDDGDNKRRQGESCLECTCRLAVEHADMLIKHLNQ